MDKLPKFRVGDVVDLNVKGTVESVSAIYGVQYGLRINKTLVLGIPEDALFPVEPQEEQPQRDKSKDARLDGHGDLFCPKCASRLRTGIDAQGGYAYCPNCMDKAYDNETGQFRSTYRQER